MKDKDQKELWESYNQLNEGAFGGPGGNPDKEGWGTETSDEVTEDDVNGRLRELSSQMNTLNQWIDHVREFGQVGNDEAFEDINDLQNSINGFVMKYNVEESLPSNEIERDDDYRGEDPPPRETDQDRYGYPGDR